MVGAIKKKKSDSAAKKSRRKYRLLDEEKAGAEEAANIENDPIEISELRNDTRQDTSSHDSSPTTGSSPQSRQESPGGKS